MPLLLFVARGRRFAALALRFALVLRLGARLVLRRLLGARRTLGALWWCALRPLIALRAFTWRATFWALRRAALRTFGAVRACVLWRAV
jgi:hypothetical protein